MITNLHLKLASSPGQPCLSIDTPPSVTIFVGPNNAGKSQALRELFAFCQSGQANQAAFIVDKLTFAAGDPEIVRAEFEAALVPIKLEENVPPKYSRLGLGGEIVQVVKENYFRARNEPNENSASFAQWYLRYFTLNLDGPSRIGLVNPQARGDLKRPATPLARLLCDNPKRESLRAILYDAFQMYFALDAQAGDQLSIRFGMAPPPDERSFNDEAIDYMRKARGMEAVSDGVKAFTGILLQVSVGSPKVIIIDEPEAFLHPSLALKLGKELAKAAALENKHVFAATHSPQFIMGAILSGAKVNIVRLTYQDGVGAARLLSSSELATLMQDTLLRSVGVLSGLFYDHVIVGEADADRAFYQEINERLLAANDPRGIHHALFLNAVGKDTISRIIEPLRRLGIPAAAIVDIDIFNQGGDPWTRHLRACAVPEKEHQPYGARRSLAHTALSSADT